MAILIYVDPYSQNSRSQKSTQIKMAKVEKRCYKIREHTDHCCLPLGTLIRMSCKVALSKCLKTKGKPHQSSYVDHFKWPTHTCTCQEDGFARLSTEAKHPTSTLQMKG